MTDAEAKLRLLKVLYEFEAAGLSFVSLLERLLEEDGQEQVLEEHSLRG